MCFNFLKRKKVEQNTNTKVQVQKKHEKYYVGIRMDRTWGFISEETNLSRNEGFSSSLSEELCGALVFNSLKEASDYVEEIFNTVLNRYNFKNRKGIDVYDEIPIDERYNVDSQFNIVKFYNYGYLSGGWYATVKLMIVKDE